MEKKFFWGLPDQERWTLAESIDAAHSAARGCIDDEHDQGDVVEYDVGEAVPALVAEDSKHTRVSIAERVIEQLDEWAADNSGAEEETFELSKEGEWHAIDYAPKDRRLLVKTESGEIYAAHWVQNPWTGDEAWLVSEAPDGTQHLVQPVEWREI